ncbi:CDP-alcohol phosphatidyltransferase family protein [Roseomonas elaeocarpi]|uniref:CDP-alcohol phosphatidyltransferase family protein n=1 Tax=Roseomonas elaeocarpi TaxID=907779 RepID=A0ABV6JS07_9PROT
MPEAPEADRDRPQPSRVDRGARGAGPAEPARAPGILAALRRGPVAADPHRHDTLLTLPNILTFARLLAVPATVWLVIHHRPDLAFLLFVAAGVTDAVDGWLARRLDARSTLGAVLDPAADKALLVSIYVALAVTEVLPDWLAILVVFRDVLIVGGLAVLLLLGMPPAIRPLFISKVNTVLQILLAATALMFQGWRIDAPILLDALVWLTAAVTVASGAAYVRAVLRGQGAA